MHTKVIPSDQWKYCRKRIIPRREILKDTGTYTNDTENNKDTYPFKLFDDVMNCKIIIFIWWYVCNKFAKAHSEIKYDYFTFIAYVWMHTMPKWMWRGWLGILHICVFGYMQKFSWDDDISLLLAVSLLWVCVSCTMQFILGQKINFDLKFWWFYIFVFYVTLYTIRGHIVVQTELVKYEWGIGKEGTWVICVWFVGY